MKTKSISLKEISKIEITKPKLTQSEKVIEYLKTHKRASIYQISRAINMSAHSAEVLGHLEENGIIEGIKCECGKGIIYQLKNLK